MSILSVTAGREVRRPVHPTSKVFLTYMFAGACRPSEGAVKRPNWECEGNWPSFSSPALCASTVGNPRAGGGTSCGSECALVW